MSQKGVKHDSGKPPLSILTKESLIAEARAFEFGAQKYGRDNYKLGMEWTRVVDAALRHLTAWNSGEDLDPESLYSHLWHAKACIAMLVYFEARQVGVDDRATDVAILSNKKID